jgi:ANTAR domain
LETTGSPEGQERSWIAGERDAGAGDRDRLADEREATADARDALADERDQAADAREAVLSEREARLDARGQEPDAEGERARARAQREQSRLERDRHQADREAAAAGRAQAAQRRASGVLVAEDGDGADDGEHTWRADKRDFVADWRDYLADHRDAIADSRDALADERDRLADVWEELLDEREARNPDSETATAGIGEERARSRELRADAIRERELRRAERDLAIAARTQYAQLRADATPATGLALTFAEIARHLYDAVSTDDVLIRLTDVAVTTVPGCEMASITVRQDDGTFTTVASTHEAAATVDRAQYKAGEGPSMAAVGEALVYTPAFPDPRWPTLGGRPAEAGVSSAVSYSLDPSGPARDTVPTGSLSAYASAAHAFDDEAREVGLILAANAAVAVRAVAERDALERMGRQLRDALSSRDVIGQAKGILMERLRITPEDAFDTLRRSSQRLNVKLREIAEKLAETGELG